VEVVFLFWVFCCVFDLVTLYFRWVVLGKGRLMNAASGKCLAAYEMQAYAIVRYCDETDLSQKWLWESAISENIYAYVNSTVRHVDSGYYMRCGCLG